MSRYAYTFLAAGVLWLLCSATARAAQSLDDVEQYDLITLDAANNNEQVKIKPVSSANGASPRRGRRIRGRG